MRGARGKQGSPGVGWGEAGPGGDGGRLGEGNRGALARGWWEAGLEGVGGRVREGSRGTLGLREAGPGQGGAEGQGGWQGGPEVGRAVGRGVWAGESWLTVLPALFPAPVRGAPAAVRADIGFRVPGRLQRV